MLYRLSILGILLLLSPSSLSAQCADGSCSYSDCHTPARPVPNTVWGELEPVDSSPLPSNRDNSGFDQFGDFETHPYWMALDVAPGRLFAAASRRLQIWSLDSPGAPQLTWDAGFRSLPLTWTPDAHAFFLFEDIAAADAGEIFAATGRYGIGIAVWDASNPASPRFVYQDHGNGRWGNGVATTSVNGRTYALLTADQEGGAFLYDLTTAKALPVACQEGRPSLPACPGIYLDQLALGTAFSATTAGPLVAYSTLNSVELWYLAPPNAPAKRLTLPATTRSVALISAGGHQVLAYRELDELHLLNVDCALSGPCVAPPTLSTLPLTPSASPTLSPSVSNGTPVLYAGDRATCPTGQQREWVFDLTDPSTPRDMTPTGTLQGTLNPTRYWGWYYRPNGIYGFNYLAPREAKFQGDYLYRAAHSILDVHRRRPLSLPLIHSLSVTPDAPSGCNTVAFSATTAGEGPLAYLWRLTGPTGNLLASSTSPSFTWAPSPSSPTGTHTIFLRLSNAFGTTTQDQDFPLLPSTITLEAAGPTLEAQLDSSVRMSLSAQPVDTWTWSWGDGSQTILTGPAGREASHVYAAPGLYSVRVQVANCADSKLSAATSIPVTRVTLQILDFHVQSPAVCIPDGGCFGPINFPVPFAHEISGQPSQYLYDWDANGTPDQVSPTPLAHTYRRSGTFRPTLTVTAGSQSASKAHPVDLTISGTNGTPPASPSNFAATADGAARAFSWSDVATEDAYRLFAHDGATWQELALLPANSTSKTSTPPFPSTRFRLDASNDAGTSSSYADLAPGAADIFSDGFESGDLSAWSSSTP